MEAKKNILTYEGLKKYEEELQDLKVVKRREVAEKIKEAREQGDLSENAEYDAAKDEQRDIEARIEELEKILKNAEVVDEDEVDLEVINIGCRVKILDVEYNDELEYKIVGSTEANSLKGKISNESPVGKALIGKKVGEVIAVEGTPMDFRTKKEIGRDIDQTYEALILGNGYDHNWVLNNHGDFKKIAEMTDTGIDDNEAETSVRDIYSINGGKSNIVRKGMNIIRFSNGELKKIYIK